MEKLVSMILEQMERLQANRQGPVIVAVDGNCGAGKTTLVSMLQEVCRCNVFHIDDFFLRPEQRVPERYAQPGGNVDYERFREEVLIPLQKGEAFSYRPFDCSSFALSEPVAVEPKRLNIVEGTYCLHPYFGDAYDLKVFLSVAPQLQRRRILQRPPFLHDRFFREWIPMEQIYFAHFDIAKQADILLHVDDRGEIK